MSGPIPSALFDLPLKQLGLSHNRLTGTIPESIGEDLELFLCSHNRLSGPIPAVVFNVEQIKLSHNSVSGALPETFVKGKWRRLDLSYNQLFGEIPWEFLYRPDHDNYVLALQLDLSHNQFSGAIPLLPPSWIERPPEEVSFKYNCLTSVVPVDEPVYMDFDREQIIEAYKSLFFPQNEGYGLIIPYPMTPDDYLDYGLSLFDNDEKQAYRASPFPGGGVSLFPRAITFPFPFSREGDARVDFRGRGREWEKNRIFVYSRRARGV